tara:strand:+ start:1839 stop:2579 length:741 start_codon:yes stop_codon:yes gene_type:complete
MKDFIKQKLREDLEYHHASDATKDEYVISENNNSFTLYHGSQHKINSKEGFLTKYVLSGEGLNAFGWGLYFTDVIEIAKFYSRNNRANELNKFLTLANDFGIDSVVDFIEFIDMQDGWGEISKETEVFLKKNKNKSISKLFKGGILYTVQITPSKNKTLDWFESIESSELELLNINNDNMTGKDVYNYLINELGSDKLASKYLYNNDYFAIKYPTESYVKVKTDTKGYNYVIFNEKDIKITNIENQ